MVQTDQMNRNQQMRIVDKIIIHGHQWARVMDVLSVQIISPSLNGGSPRWSGPKRPCSPTDSSSVGGSLEGSRLSVGVTHLSFSSKSEPVFRHSIIFLIDNGKTEEEDETGDGGSG